MEGQGLFLGKRKRTISVAQNVVYPQLPLAEEKCEEAESRVRQLEQHVIHDDVCQLIALLHK